MKESKMKKIVFFLFLIIFLGYLLPSIILVIGDEGEDTIYHKIPPPQTLGWSTVVLLIAGLLYIPIKRLRFLIQNSLGIRTENYLRIQQISLTVHMLSNMTATIIVLSHIFAEGGLKGTPGYVGGFNGVFLMVLLSISGFILWRRFPTLSYDEGYERATRHLHVQIVGFFMLVFSIILHITALQNTVPPSCGGCHTAILSFFNGV